MVQVQSGVENFQKLVQSGGIFVDKTLFIPALFSDLSEVIVITRPRRFGKTLNLSMLHHFLAEEVAGVKTAPLFEGLKIAAPEYVACREQHQGKYPVISLTLKNLARDSFEGSLQNIRDMASALYAEHSYLEESDRLRPPDKKGFLRIWSQEGDQGHLESSLQELSRYLFIHHGKKPWILVDEYDAPIQASYMGGDAGYYKSMTAFISNFLGLALKTNQYVYRGLLTGVLRVAKESLVSQFNNAEVYSVLQPGYSEYFGFTEDEVDLLLKRAGREGEGVRQWYNGYRFGETVIYNPWSIMHYLKEGKLGSYWVNTGRTTLVDELMACSPGEITESLQTLLEGGVIKSPLDEGVVFASLKGNVKAFWSLLLHMGYLKVVGSEELLNETEYQLEIPNDEIRRVFSDTVKSWFSKGQMLSWIVDFVGNLANAKLKEWSASLLTFVREIVSPLDPGMKPETFYHGLMLGLVATLRPAYELGSNEPSADGRYDICLFPMDRKERAIVIELKSAETLESVDREAKEALEQIEVKGYDVQARKRGLERIVKIGLAFHKRKVAIHAIDDRGTSFVMPGQDAGEPAKG